MLGLEVRDPEKFRDDIDPILAGFLRKACAVERKNRFQTACDMLDALNEIRLALRFEP